MSERFVKVKEEFLALIPPTIFFFIALHIVALIRALMTRGTGIAASSTMSIAIAALILGKSVLLADIVWPHFWAIQILLFVLILMYCTSHEVVRLIGKDRAWQVFFGSRPGG